MNQGKTNNAYQKQRYIEETNYQQLDTTTSAGGTPNDFEKLGGSKIRSEISYNEH